MDIKNQLVESSLPGLWEANCATPVAGVYGVLGVLDGNLYIGGTLDMGRRWQQHRSALKNERHYNGRLQGAYRHYGKNNFVFLVLQTTDDPLDLCKYEQEWINHYARNGNLYNISLIVPKTHPGGHKLSEETRQKQSEAKQGPKHPAFGKRKRIEQTRAKFYRFISPDGEIVESLGLKALCEKNQLNCSHMSKIARGKLRQHKGWRLAEVISGKDVSEQQLLPG